MPEGFFLLKKFRVQKRCGRICRFSAMEVEDDTCLWIFCSRTIVIYFLLFSSIYKVGCACESYFFIENREKVLVFTNFFFIFASASNIKSDENP